MWDNRAKSKHYVRTEWPPPETMMPGYHNVIHQKKIILLPLYIKLGLMKQFTKALQQNESCFQYLKVIFPKISEGIFVDLQICLNLIINFEATMGDIKLATWYAFKNVFKIFLARRMCIVENLHKFYQNLT